MRGPIVLAAIFAALLVAEPAAAAGVQDLAGARTARASQGVCQCMIKFANRYVHRASYRRQVARKMAHRGIGPLKRRRTKRGIYDWQKDHTNLPNWCRRGEFNRKACRAALACIGAAGVTLANEGTSRRAWRHAATACAGAAAVVWASP